MNNHLHPLFRGILNGFATNKSILTDQQKIASYALKHSDKDKPEVLSASLTDMSPETITIVERSLVKQSQQRNKN